MLASVPSLTTKGILSSGALVMGSKIHREELVPLMHPVVDIAVGTIHLKD